MVGVISDRTWITGEAFNRERRRLIQAGHEPDSPEFRELRRRMSERNDYIWETYGRPLIDQHYGKWAAISIRGEVILADTEVEAMKKGRERFGAGDYCLARLDPMRGAHRIGPRSG